MKYTEKNEPLKCFLTESACYKGTRPMKPLGVLWHSTGANNPKISRYVQPADGDPNREEMAELLGPNRYNNDYNHQGRDRQMGVNAWIGKLADGTVTTVQTMPWDWKPWGCGGDSKGSCNDGWIQFEICEDNLANPDYAKKAYDEACEITAYLCKMFNIDPLGYVAFRGVRVPTIIDHRTSHQLGLGNNHGDVYHWFPKTLNKYLPEIRKDVAILMGIDINAHTDAPDTPVVSVLGTRTLRRGMDGDDVAELQAALISIGYAMPKYGADGDYGSETYAAVTAFQKDNGLDPDGIFGPLSLAALNKRLSGEAPQPEAPAPDNTTFKIRVTGNVVNVRSKPSISDGPVVRYARRDDILVATGMDPSEKWYVLSDGCYISATYSTKI